MAHAQSHTKRIWNVFWILSAITIVEVILGIYKPDVLHLTSFFRNKSIKLVVHHFNTCQSLWNYLGIHAYGG